MFREAGGALSGHPSQDNCLDGPFSSGASKLEQVPLLHTAHTAQNTKLDSKNTDNPKYPGSLYKKREISHVTVVTFMLLYQSFCQLIVACSF